MLKNELIELKNITEKIEATDNFLLQQSKQWKFAFDAVPDAIFITNEAFDIKFANKAFVKHFDVTRDLLLNTKCYKLLFNLDDSQKCICKGQNGGFRSYGEVYNSRLNKWYLFDRAPILDDNDVVLGHINILRDITEEKTLIDARNEEEIAHKATLAKAQLYLDVVGVMLVSLDLKGNVTLINKKGCKVLEGDEQDIIGKNWFDTFISEEDRPNIYKLFKRVTCGIDVSKSEYSEHNIVSLRGNTKLIAWHNTVIKDPQGNISGVLSSGEDITEQSKLNQILIESENKYKTLFTSASDALFLLDGSIFIDCNPCAAALFGYDYVDIIGKTVMDVSPKKQVDGSFSALKAKYFIRKALNGKPQFFEWRHLKKDGAFFDVEVMLNDIKIQGEQKLQAIVRDITNRKLVNN